MNGKQIRFWEGCGTAHFNVLFEISPWNVDKYYKKNSSLNITGNLTEVTGFSLWRPKFNPRVVRVGFVVNKVALQQDFSASFYSTSVP